MLWLHTFTHSSSFCIVLWNRLLGCKERCPNYYYSWLAVHANSCLQLFFTKELALNKNVEQIFVISLIVDGIGHLCESGKRNIFEIFIIESVPRERMKIYDYSSKTIELLSFFLGRAMRINGLFITKMWIIFSCTALHCPSMAWTFPLI